MKMVRYDWTEKEKKKNITTIVYNQTELLSVSTSSSSSREAGEDEDEEQRLLAEPLTFPSVLLLPLLLLLHLHLLHLLDAAARPLPADLWRCRLITSPPPTISTH